MPRRASSLAPAYAKWTSSNLTRPVRCAGSGTGSAGAGVEVGVSISSLMRRIDADAC